MNSFHAAGVVDVDGRPAGNVVVTFDAVEPKRAVVGRRPPVPPAVRTDKLGRFAQDGFANGTAYTVTATAPGVSFEAQRFDAEHSALRLHGTTSTFSASGVVRVAQLIAGTGKPPGVDGVTITFVRTAGRADRPVPAGVVTGADGTWRQDGFQVGVSFDAVPAKPGFAFAPAAVAVDARASSELTASSSVFTVSGRVTTLGAAVEAGVTITFARTSGSGAVPGPVTTDGTGSFSQGGFDRATHYRVTPTKPGITFDPASRDVAFAANSLPILGASFVRRTNLAVDGQVLTTGGAGLLGAMITFTRTAGTGAVPRPVVTGSNGEFHAAGLDTGSTYLVAGTGAGFVVRPTELRATGAGTTTVHLTAAPAYTVTGRVLELAGPVVTFAPDLLDDLPGVPGAVLDFHRDDGRGAPAAVATAADGSFRQSGFEVGARYVVDAHATGFVGTQLVNPLPFSSGSIVDGSSRPFSSDEPTQLDNVTLLLQRA